MYKIYTLTKEKMEEKNCLLSLKKSIKKLIEEFEIYSKKLNLEESKNEKTKSRREGN